MTAALPVSMIVCHVPIKAFPSYVSTHYLPLRLSKSTHKYLQLYVPSYSVLTIHSFYMLKSYQSSLADNFHNVDKIKLLSPHLKTSHPIEMHLHIHLMILRSDLSNFQMSFSFATHVSLPYSIILRTQDVLLPLWSQMSTSHGWHWYQFLKFLSSTSTFANGAPFCSHTRTFHITFMTVHGLVQ